MKKSNWSLEKLLAHTEGRGRNGFPVDSGLASRSSPGWQGVSGQSPRRLPASACHTAWDLKTVSAGPCSPWLPAYHIVDFFFFFEIRKCFPHLSNGFALYPWMSCQTCLHSDFLVFKNRTITTISPGEMCFSKLHFRVYHSFFYKKLQFTLILFTHTNN